MTIEETLSRLAINSGRIADALEAIAGSQGIVPDMPGDDDEKPVAKKKATTKKKTAKKTATKKKASKKKASKKVGKKKAEVETDLTIKDDVRPVLKQLREEVSHAAVKSLLKKHGASTIQQLDPANFQRIIDDANAELGIDPDDDDADDIDDELQDELDLDDDDDL